MTNNHMIYGRERQKTMVIGYREKGNAKSRNVYSGFKSFFVAKL
jgi:hypothetical protein